MVELEGIKDSLSYDPDTGVFHRLNTSGGRLKGSVAGCLGSQGYMQLRYKNITYSSHRLAFWFMSNIWPKDCVDHINGVPDDNRWSNLREATVGENLQNMRSRGGSSCYKGVRNKLKRWTSQIKSKEFGQKTLGSFLCEKEAALAYNYAALEHFRSFARFNQVFEDVSEEALSGEA